jgi:hypothetical protein
MLHRLSDLRGLTIKATDGDIGATEDIYFDSKTWRVRYLAVDTGHWLPGRHVVIGPQSVQQVLGTEKQLLVSLTKARVEGSPDVTLDPPVSRQHEIAWHRYHEYPYYWAVPEIWPLGSAGPLPIPDRAEEELAARETGDPNLHSARVVTGYYIAATDGDIGHVDDFLVDVGEWSIRYMVVDTRNWLPGKHVLVSPTWIREVDWAGSRVHVDLSREVVTNSPAFDPDVPLERAYEDRLFRHYERPPYWPR